MQTHSPLKVLRVFLKLGLSSFGGPVAHIGFVLLIMWRAPPLLVVVIGAVAGVALAQTH
jgi:chromate transport protein ChrA